MQRVWNSAPQQAELHPPAGFGFHSVQPRGEQLTAEEQLVLQREWADICQQTKSLAQHGYRKQPGILTDEKLKTASAGQNVLDPQYVYERVKPGIDFNADRFQWLHPKHVDSVKTKAWRVQLEIALATVLAEQTKFTLEMDMDHWMSRVLSCGPTISIPLRGGGVATYATATGYIIVCVRDSAGTLQDVFFVQEYEGNDGLAPIKPKQLTKQLKTTVIPELTRDGGCWDYEIMK
eukprot:TRINITY_DN7108_c0_g1_i1.p1 TRINITY_DN7108_c0_g1~~TRINITY_DN7108_c0_g1_i1.p1  ORF type:complete len:234 (-),score=17.66 TRINITY_DN7108_c0_g1_i1:51-752(-)